MMIQKINNQGLRQKQERSLHKADECFPMDRNADFGINRSALKHIITFNFSLRSSTDSVVNKPIFLHFVRIVDVSAI